MNISTPISCTARKAREHFKSLGDLPVGKPIKSASGYDLRSIIHDAYLRDEGLDDLSPGRGVVQALERQGSDALPPNHTTVHYQGAADQGWVSSTRFVSKDGEAFNYESLDLVVHEDVRFQGQEATSMVLLEGQNGFEGFITKQIYENGITIETQAKTFSHLDYENYLLAAL